MRPLDFSGPFFGSTLCTADRLAATGRLAIEPPSEERRSIAQAEPSPSTPLVLFNAGGSAYGLPTQVIRTLFVVEVTR